MSLARRFQPRRLRLEVQRLRKKWTGRLLQRDREVLRLSPGPDHGQPRGEVLVSYVLDGVRQALAGTVEHSHTHFWEAHRIAQTFVDLGYAVDVVHWQNATFEPTKPYAAVVDVRNNLERWAPRLPDDCVKIFHGETAHWKFHHEAQAERYEALMQRRGVVLQPVRPAEQNRGIETADRGFILGNNFTLTTYQKALDAEGCASTPLSPLRISTTAPCPDYRRSEESARRFLWFGSNDMVHKGLDLVLEAVANRPHLELTVCGPIHREPAFERLYERELYGLPNVTTLGWIDTQSAEFERVASHCSALVFPSCSEANCGGVITCMHAGLVPILTDACGIDLDPAFGHILRNAEIATIAEAMENHAAHPWSEIEAMNSAVARFARTHHTREQFSQRYLELAQTALSS